MKINILEKIFNWNIGNLPSFIIYFVVLISTSIILEHTKISSGEVMSISFCLYVLSVLQIFIALIYSWFRK